MFGKHFFNKDRGGTFSYDYSESQSFFLKGTFLRSFQKMFKNQHNKYAVSPTSPLTTSLPV